MRNIKKSSQIQIKDLKQDSKCLTALEGDDQEQVNMDIIILWRPISYCPCVSLSRLVMNSWTTYYTQMPHWMKEQFPILK